jgi:fructose-specific phosphotransferase system IIA component
MVLTDILTEQRIKAPLAATTKQGVIEELVDLLVASGEVADREKLLSAVLEREKTRTTGIGGGLALPHGKCGAVKDLMMAVGKPAVPVDFESIDGKPVTLVFMLVGPTGMVGPHIQALAHIARLMSIDSFKNKLNAAASPADILRLFRDQEEQGE